MRVDLDTSLCQGYVCCLVNAPEVFSVDEETGKATLLVPEPAEALRTKVVAAVRSCPTQAISIEE